MALDHAGHQRHARQLDGSRVGGHGDRRTGGGDLVADDQHRPALVRMRIDPVEDPRRVKEDGGGLGEGRRGKQGEEE